MTKMQTYFSDKTPLQRKLPGICDYI